MSADAKAWAARPAVARWLALDPPLAGTALGTYFFYSRDQLSPVAAGARLTGAQQEVLARLQVEVSAQRDAAVAETASMGALDRMAIYRALLELAKRDPQSLAMRSALDIAVAVEGVGADFAAALREIPPNSVPTQLPLQVMVAFGKKPPPAIDAALDEWHSNGGKRIRSAVEAARG